MLRSQDIPPGVHLISERTHRSLDRRDMPPKYKLTYFQITGLGEAIRFVLSYGNLDFEDVRVKWEDWESVKPSAPFGRLPTLEMDGKVIHQSEAICRYLAKQLGIGGKDDWEAMQMDIVVGTLKDMCLAVAQYYYNPDEEARAAKREPLIKETIPFFMSRFDKIVQDNGGYFVGGQLSWADLYFVGIGDYIGKLAGMDIYEGYPNMQRLKNNVVTIPQIKAWIEKRPEDILFTFKKK